MSDWWEEYIYLRGRGPIMVNSNYYAMVRRCNLSVSSLQSVVDSALTKPDDVPSVFDLLQFDVMLLRPNSLLLNVSMLQ